MKAALSISKKEIWKIAYPIILGNLAQTILAITDTAFLGHYSEIALGASMMCGIFYFVWATLPFGFGIGFQVLVARRFGEGNYLRIGAIFQHGLRIAMVLGLALLTILYLVTPTLLRAIITSPNILEASLEFMSFRVWGIAFVSINFLMRYFFIGISQTKVIAYSTVIMTIVNIVLDYTFIYGKWGFPEIGIGGAALASFLAEVSAFIFFIIYFFTKLPLKKYYLNVYHKFEMWLVKALLNLAFPAMIQKLIAFGAWFIFFIFVEKMGELPIAVSGIIRSLYMLLGIPAMAFGATANTIVSRLIGSGKREEVVATLRRITFMGYLCMLPIIIFCIAAPELLLSIYTDNAELIAASIHTLYVLCVAMIFFVPGFAYFEAVSGTGNTKHGFYIEVIVISFYTLGIYLFMDVFTVGIAAAWLVETIYAIAMFGLSYLYIKKYNWQKTII